MPEAGTTTLQTARARPFLIMLIAASALAQPAFEVASVKQSRIVPGEGGNWPKVIESPGGVTMHNHTLRDCIQWAWRVRPHQVAGPAWIDEEKYEIAARASGPASSDQLRLMVQSLLAERFKLELHREARDLAVYALLPVRTGPRLPTATAGESGWSKLPGPGLRLSFRKSTMTELAEFLSMLVFVDRPVVDRTGLDRAYDFNLDLHEVSNPADAPPGPSVSTVLQEQLGLKLEARKEPIEVLVIDRAERVPTGN